MELVVSKNDLTTTQSNYSTLLVEFLRDQDIKANSKSLYRRTLSQYFAWIQAKGYHLTEIDRAQVLEYKEGLLETGKSPLTVGSYITSVKLFYEWAEAKKYYPNIAKGIKNPKRKKQFRKQPLTPGQTKNLLSYLQTAPSRDRAIVNLLVRTGLRTVEVARATIGDITFKSSQRVLLVHGKGRAEKDNFVVLTDKAWEPISEYLKTRENLSDSDPLFISTSNNSTGEPLSTRTISYIAKEGLKAIGLDSKHFTAHSLRHTTAVNILRAGGSLETAQYTLRHSNPATTQIYTATVEEERRLKNSGEALLDTMY